MASWTWWLARRVLANGRVLYAYRSICNFGVLGVASSRHANQFVEVWQYPNVDRAIEKIMRKPRWSVVIENNRTPAASIEERVAALERAVFDKNGLPG